MRGPGRWGGVLVAVTLALALALTACDRAPEDVPSPSPTPVIPWRTQSVLANQAFGIANSMSEQMPVRMTAVLTDGPAAAQLLDVSPDDLSPTAMWLVDVEGAFTWNRPDVEVASPQKEGTHLAVVVVEGHVGHRSVFQSGPITLQSEPFDLASLGEPVVVYPRG